MYKNMQNKNGIKNMRNYRNSRGPVQCAQSLAFCCIVIQNVGKRVRWSVFADICRAAITTTMNVQTVSSKNMFHSKLLAAHLASKWPQFHMHCAFVHLQIRQLHKRRTTTNMW